MYDRGSAAGCNTHDAFILLLERNTHIHPPSLLPSLPPSLPPSLTYLATFPRQPEERHDDKIVRPIFIDLGLLVFELERVFHTQRVEGILDCKSQNRQPVSKEWREGGRDIERVCECGWVCLSWAAGLRA